LLDRHLQILSEQYDRAVEINVWIAFRQVDGVKVLLDVGGHLPA
jgi:hypothetical protein